MEIVSEPLLEVDSKSFVEKIKERIDKRGGNSDQTQVKYSLKEYRFIFFNDWFHDLSVETSYVDTEEGSQNQENSQQKYIQNLFTLPSGNHDFQQFFYPAEKNRVDISSSSFLTKFVLTLCLLGLYLSLIFSVDDFLFFM